MKFLVTGGSGFLGTHIAHELEQAGHEVEVADIAISRFHDLRFPELVERAFDDSEPECCIHLAARVGRLFGEDAVLETIVDNAGMTALVAQECGRRGVRMAYASTSEVYGDQGSAVCYEHAKAWMDAGKPPNATWFRETHLPHNTYGLSKRHGEEYCRLYAPEQLTIFRFSMPYGPGLPAGRGRAAIINMLHQALHGKPIPVHRGAERSWCYVTDTARAVRMVLESEPNGIWNVGRDDAAVPMLTVAQIACELTGADPNLIVQVDPPSMQTVVKRLSTERIRGLGWEPEVGLVEGMTRTLDWVRSLDAEGAVAA